MNKYDKWWNSLTPQMQEYLKRQPVWYDRDMWKAGLIGFVVGILLGLLF